jgi:hypothetical protein
MMRRFARPRKRSLPDVTTMASGPDGDDEAESTDWLSAVDDGCGCAEIWETLSDRRADPNAE